MNEEFNNDRKAIEERFDKELNAFLSKYPEIKGLKVEVTNSSIATKMGNFDDYKVKLRVEI